MARSGVSGPFVSEEEERKRWSVELLSAGDAPASVQLARRNFKWGFDVVVLRKRTCKLADEVFLCLRYFGIWYKRYGVWDFAVGSSQAMISLLCHL